MKYIESFREGERVSGIYLCKFRQSALTKAGKSYENLIFQDKTGTIDSKIWDPNSGGIEDFDAMDYVDIVADVTMFQGQPQLNVKRARKAREGEYNPADYLPVSSKDIEVMYKELLGFVAKVKDPYLSKLLKSLFVEDVEFAKAFKFSSAAKTVHHGFVGGLLEHTLSVTKLCEYYVNYYPMINADLLYTAAMCHDIGKVYELSPFPENDYTDEGQLLGHIMIGAEMVGDRIRDIPGFPIKLGNELKHCILAHHGELEYGSPKKPALLEAVALNFADNTDAHLQTMIEALTAAGENQGWLGYNRLFESNIRKTSK
ncbi:MAG: HD domain-containing protein [Lachnospiraceae bacterium]|uniref:HD domain-containing protein n=1 Tax=Hominiventricola filiformis TaxID=2885352 RepID=A0AAE3A997_9FIRM|nr:HD domain-containing protein [Hominiventricola filiformis]MCC2125861.1 HD domain-containing protein [Hominiventricola filiformis]MDY3825607.1 HD domain-containing protein [Lachnospiraceae bacterium]QUO23177.1 HD domain-containing protein [Clostridiaceae bacterium Marseille-Q4143]